MYKDKISIVIATRNREEALLLTISKLLVLPEQPTIIVVDNHSTDTTVEKVKKYFPAVMILALSENKGAAARNKGAEAVQTPYVAFCDDDSYWAPGALCRAVSYFEQYPKLGLLAGKILVGEAQVLDPVCEAMAQSPLPQLVPMPGPAILGFIACGAIVRKEAFLSAGGFHEQFGIGGEEELLAVDLLAMGWGLSYTEDVIGYHFPSPVRNTDRRIQVQTRNSLWFTWLRRPFQQAIRQTFRVYQQGKKDPNIRKGFTESFQHIRQIVRYRRVVPQQIEQQLQLLYNNRR